MSVMFASNRGQPVAASGHLMEFKAGRTMMEPGSTPEKRKAVAMPESGLVYIKHSQDDTLLHFCWQNRETKKTDLELIIFPGGTEFKRIIECQDGRVYMLKFKDSDERHLFWLQEPKDDKKDDELCKKVNELLSNAPPSRPAGRTDRRTEAGALGNEMDRFAALNDLIGGNPGDIGPLGNMDQNQLMRLFSLMNSHGGSMQPSDLINLARSTASGGGTAPATTVTAGAGGTATPATTKSQQDKAGKDSKKETGVITSQMLGQLIEAATKGASQSKQSSVDLSTVLTRSKTQETIDKHKEQLKPHLPDQSPLQDADKELVQTVGNPQFQQAADFFGHILQSGQASAALEQFGLNKDVVEAAAKGDLKQFAEKLSQQEGNKDVDKKIAEEAEADEALTASAAAADKTEEQQKCKDLQKPPRDDDDEMGLD